MLTCATFGAEKNARYNEIAIFVQEIILVNGRAFQVLYSVNVCVLVLYCLKIRLQKIKTLGTFRYFQYIQGGSKTHKVYATIILHPYVIESCGF